jgi:competence protein ComEC
MRTEPHNRRFTIHPLAQLSVALCLGIAASNYFPIGSKIPIIACGICTLLTLLSFAISRYSISSLLIVLAFFITGYTLNLHAQQPGNSRSIKSWLSTQQLDPEQTVILTGVLTRPPELARDRLYLTLSADEVLTNNNQAQINGLVSLLASFNSAASKQEYDALQLRFGTRIRVRVKLNLIDKYRNPGVSTLSAYLEATGFDLAGVIKSASSITRLGDTRVFPPLGWVYDWRLRLQRTIDESFSPETAGVLDATLLGNKHNLTRLTADRFRESGTFHVLVISGLHISFLGGLVLLLVSRITRNRLSRFAVSGAVVWVYSIAVGAESSVVRAALMFTIITMASVLFRQPTALNALGGAALVLLTLDPRELFDPSFQLTFLSVLAIVVIAWPLLQKFAAIGGWRPTHESPYPPVCSRPIKFLCEILYWSELHWTRELARSSHSYKLFKSKLPMKLERLYLQHLVRYLAAALIVSLAVQLMLLPVLIFYFHRLSPASLILNVVVSVLLALTAGAAMAALSLAQLSQTLAQPLFHLTEFITWLMLHSVDPFANVGVASIRVAELSGLKSLIYVAYYLPLLRLLVVVENWRPLVLSPVRKSFWRSGTLASLFQGLLLIVVLCPQIFTRGDGKLHFDFLDVGQGDAALVTMPDGTTLLIDGGGQPRFLNAPKGTSVEGDFRSIGEKVVSEYLWWRGLDRVDYILATHADADHIDGLNDVLRNFNVRGAFVGRSAETELEFAKLNASLVLTKTPLEKIQNGDRLLFGPVEVQVLWPLSTDGPSRNNDSVVLRFQFGNHTVLMTGDIERETERLLVSRDAPLKVDVVKVPHHGSRTSSTESFVRASSPQWAIISVGQASMFGHPHKEVVTRWLEAGSTVLTTGKCGTIRVTTDGRELSVKKFVENF